MNFLNANHKRKTHNVLKATIFTGSLLTFTALTGTILASTTAKADVVDTVVATLATSCSLTGTGTDSHTTSLTGGVLASNIGTTTLTATCNDAGGFGIYAVGYSSDTEGTTAMISSAGSTYNIATGTATSGSTSNWAMKVTPGTNTTSTNSFNAYHAVPANYTRVVERASGVDMGTVAAATTTYQIFPTTTQAAGTYTGKVKYTLVHPSTEDCPEGYTMEGGVCKKKQTISTITNMQEMTSTICTASALNETKQLKDTRDNKLYWVTKLADNNCWMTQNLDLDLSTSTALTSTDSDVTSSWTPTISTGTSAGFWFELYDEPVSYDPGDTQYLVTSGSTSKDMVYKSLSACTTAGNAEAVCQHGHSGNYYNWNAATAGSDASGMDDGDEAPQSICPKGWRLPYGTQANKSWYYMLSNSISGYGDNATTSQAMRTSPFYIPRSGYTYGEVGNIGSRGGYWSSTASGEVDDFYFAYYLMFLDSNVYPQYDEDAGGGYSVRCVAR